MQNPDDTVKQLTAGHGRQSGKYTPAAQYQKNNQSDQRSRDDGQGTLEYVSRQGSETASVIAVSRIVDGFTPEGPAVTCHNGTHGCLIKARIGSVHHAFGCRRDFNRYPAIILEENLHPRMSGFIRQHRRKITGVLFIGGKIRRRSHIPCYITSRNTIHPVHQSGGRSKVNTITFAVVKQEIVDNILVIRRIAGGSGIGCLVLQSDQNISRNLIQICQGFRLAEGFHTGKGSGGIVDIFPQDIAPIGISEQTVDGVIVPLCRRIRHFSRGKIAVLIRTTVRAFGHDTGFTVLRKIRGVDIGGGAVGQTAEPDGGGTVILQETFFFLFGINLQITGVADFHDFKIIRIEAGRRGQQIVHFRYRIGGIINQIIERIGNVAFVIAIYIIDDTIHERLLISRIAIKIARCYGESIAPLAVIVISAGIAFEIERICRHLVKRDCQLIPAGLIQVAAIDRTIVHAVGGTAGGMSDNVFYQTVSGIGSAE